MYQFNWNLETYHSCLLTAVYRWPTPQRSRYLSGRHMTDQRSFLSCIEQDNKFHRNWCIRFPVKSTEINQQTRINWNKTCFNFCCVWKLDVYETHTIKSNFLLTTENINITLLVLQWAFGKRLENVSDAYLVLAVYRCFAAAKNKTDFINQNKSKKETYVVIKVKCNAIQMKETERERVTVGKHKHIKYKK